MVNQVPLSYKEFEERLRLVRLHGVDALKKLINQENKSKGLTVSLDKNAVINAFGFIIGEYTALAADLLKVQKGLELNQVPRGDNKPELSNTNQGVKPAQQKGYENAPWMAKMDLAADPKLRDAFQALNDLIQNPGDQATFTAQYNDLTNKLENRLKAEHKLRNAPKFAPRPKSTPRPEPR